MLNRVVSFDKKKKFSVCCIWKWWNEDLSASFFYPYQQKKKNTFTQKLWRCTCQASYLLWHHVLKSKQLQCRRCVQNHTKTLNFNETFIIIWCQNSFITLLRTNSLTGPLQKGLKPGHWPCMCTGHRILNTFFSLSHIQVMKVRGYCTMIV